MPIIGHASVEPSCLCMLVISMPALVSSLCWLISSHASCKLSCMRLLIIIHASFGLTCVCLPVVQGTAVRHCVGEHMEPI